jgi:hypothetical protein
VDHMVFVWNTFSILDQGYMLPKSSYAYSDGQSPQGRPSQLTTRHQPHYQRRWCTSIVHSPAAHLPPAFPSFQSRVIMLKPNRICLSPIHPNAIKTPHAKSYLVAASQIPQLFPKAQSPDATRFYPKCDAIQTAIASIEHANLARAIQNFPTRG